MLKKILLLTGLIICLVSCGLKKELVQFDVAERPLLPRALWVGKEGLLCVDEIGARTLLEREIIRDSYEMQLKATVEGCNEALR